jgi:transglutaminase-like putative cysteine protease
VLLGTVLFCSFVSGFPAAATAQGLFSGENDRAYYEQLLSDRRARFPALEETLFSAIQSTRGADERDALTFLLATSPLSDITAHDGAFFLSAVRRTLAMRLEFRWSDRVPDSLFLHFVLPLRVNNEALDSARLILPGMLRERLQYMSMRSVVLEINHWCHERVTYAPSDARTRSPLATMRNARGRCGEESVFTAAALRAAGIPARQVYCPRWAHSDDNHAWVEVWVDSAWHYIGACEPDVDLSRAWFTEPARRAMLVSAPVQGRYRGAEEVIAGDMLHTRINTLPVYADTQRLQVRVIDSNGVAAAGALVDFRVYNYGEYYPLATVAADSLGRVSFLTGYGDLLVWARRGNEYTYRTVRAGERDTVRLVLESPTRKARTRIFDYAPPKAETLSVPPHTRRAEVDARLRRDDSVRAAYEATFIDSTQAVALAERLGCDADATWELLRQSRGNWREIKDFLEEAAPRAPAPALHFLEALSVKDLQDASASVLLDHFLTGLAQSTEHGWDALGDEILTHEVLSPRIGREDLRPWRALLHEAAEKMFSVGVTARGISSWVRDSIAVVEGENWSRVPLTPERVFSLRVADARSRDIFFVAFCRAAGLPARLDPVTSRPQFLDAGAWKDALLSAAAGSAEKNARLVLRLPAVRTILSPQYARHFTLARFQDGRYHTLDFEGDARFTAWPVSLDLEPGRYMLVTGNRQPDGSVLSSTEEFTLDSGAVEERILHIRDNSTRPEILAEIDEDLLPRDEALFYVLLWIEEGTEPVSHALRDIAAERRSFEGLPVRFLLAGDGRMSEADLHRTADAYLPAGAIVDATGAGELLEEVRDELRLPMSTQLPLLVVCNAEGEVTFVARGYSVGVGTQILRILERMSIPESQ